MYCYPFLQCKDRMLVTTTTFSHLFPPISLPGSRNNLPLPVLYSWVKRSKICLIFHQFDLEHPAKLRTIQPSWPNSLMLVLLTVLKIQVVLLTVVLYIFISRQHVVWTTPFCCLVKAKWCPVAGVLMDRLVSLCTQPGEDQKFINLVPRFHF